MVIEHSATKKIGILLVIFFCLISGVVLRARNVLWERTRSDFPASAERRMRPLRDTLPPDTRTVGYVSDLPTSDEETERYYTIQWVMAPVIVVRGTAQPYVVGNFRDARSIDMQTMKDKLLIVKDFGNGVVLFRSGMVR